MLRLILIALFVISCAPEKVQKSKTYVSFGAAATAQLFPGGALLVGSNLTTGHSFSVNAASGGAEFDLTNGAWEFAAIGWDGKDPMTGTMKCARTERPIALDGQDTDVTLSLTQATCRESEVFGGAALYDASGKQKNVYVHTCEDRDRFLQDPKVTPSFLAQDLLNNPGTCEGSMGAEKSFRVKFMFFNERIRSAVAANTTKIDPTTSTTTNATSTYENRNTANFSFEEGFNGSLASACINTPLPQSGSVKVGGGVSLPIFEAGVNLPYIVEAFENDDCTGNKLNFFFANGLIEKSIGLRGMGTIVPSGPNEGFNLFVDSEKMFDPCASDLARQPNTFAGVPQISYDRDRPNIICTAEQFSKLKDSTFTAYRTAKIANPNPDSNFDIPEFIIATDLDFSGISIEPISDFVGRIRGPRNVSAAGKVTLSNFSSGPKRALIDSARWISIENIDFLNFSVTSSSDTAAIVGTLEPQSTDNINESLRFSNLNINRLLVGITSAINVGGLIGFVNIPEHSHSGLEIKNVHLNFNTGDMIQGSSNVGGLIGKVASHYKINISDISISGPIVDETFNADQVTDFASLSDVISGSNNIGGIIGSSDNVKMGPHIKVQGLAIEGNQNVGGVVGLAHNTEVFGNTVAAVKLLASPASPKSFGGVIGSVSTPNVNPTNASSYIGHNMIHKLFLESTHTLSNIGGVLGEYTCESANTSSLVIQNNHVKDLSFTINGSMVGGVAGFINNSCSASQIEVTSNLVNNAYILPNTNLTTVGGLIGKATNVQKIEYNLIQAGAIGSQSEATQTITGGGLIGEIYSPSVTINSNVIRDLSLGLKSDAAASIFSAHFIGKLDSGSLTFDGNALYGQQAKFSVNSSFHTCVSNDDKCPIWVGNLNLTNTSPGLNYAATSLIGVDFNTSGSILTITTPNDDGSTWFDQISGDPLETLALVPSFLLNWSQMAGNTIDIQVAGNFVDPFQITEGSQWDSIGDDAFLMQKSFEIVNDISVSKVIASSTNPFLGTLISNGGKISGNQITAFSDNSIGLINNAGLSNQYHPTIIGTHENPLIIDNLKLQPTSAATNVGLVVGQAKNSLITARVYNSNNTTEITFPSGLYTNVGGLVGKAMNSEITASYFDGRFNGAGSITNAGGIVGRLFGGRVNFNTAFIEDGFANITNMGSLVGNLDRSTNVEVRENSTIFNISNVAGLNANSFATNLNAFIDSETSVSSSEIRFSNNIVDTRNIETNNGPLPDPIVASLANFAYANIILGNFQSDISDADNSPLIMESDIDLVDREIGWYHKAQTLPGSPMESQRYMLPYYKDRNISPEEMEDIEKQL